MVPKKSRARAAEPQALQASLGNLTQKLTGAVRAKPGSIVIHATDAAESYFLEGTSGSLSLTGAERAGEAIVRVSGPSRTLKAILDGKKDAARAFVAGGLMVRGDLEYLEALLKDAGMLQCGKVEESDG